MRKILPFQILEKFPGFNEYISTSMIDLKISWIESDAVGISMGIIYINERKVGNKYHQLREELIEKLKRVKDPQIGKK